MKAERLDSILARTVRATRRAALRVRGIERTGTYATQAKGDKTPVTEADHASQRYLISVLDKILSVPVVAEEMPAARKRVAVGRGLFWLVDPLDGTKDFISGTGEYAINVALIREGRPVIAVIAQPATGDLFFAALDSGAFWQQGSAIKRLPLSAVSASSVCLVSRQHEDNRMKSWLAASQDRPLALGSSLKFTALAKGEATAYPRFEQLREWDIAAGDLLVHEAGGGMVNARGEKLIYGQAPEFLCEPFLAWGYRLTVSAGREKQQNLFQEILK